MTLTSRNFQCPVFYHPMTSLLGDDFNHCASLRVEILGNWLNVII